MPRRAYATLRAEEVPLLLPHVPDDWRGVFASALHTGMRKGELFGLRKGDVDPPRRAILVERSYDRDKITGGHADALPIASPLLAFDAAMRAPGWERLRPPCRRCLACLGHIERHRDASPRHNGIYILRFADGKIVERWGEFDGLGLSELDDLPFRLLLLRLAPHDTAALGRRVRGRVGPCYGGAALPRQTGLARSDGSLQVTDASGSTSASRSPSPPDAPLPRIIQGGMGVGVSDWRLANAVSRLGQMGVVSGTAIDAVLARRLQMGDAGGHMRRAMAQFPIPGVAEAALERYFLPAGPAPGQPFAGLAMHTQRVSLAREQFTILAAFVEVYLAREGHEGPVGINLLTKIQMPNLALLYGAMLAGVDFVLMGAGIPREIPVALDALASHQPAQLKLDLEEAAPGQIEYLRFDPALHWSGTAPDVRRPRFLAIVASNTLATMLGKKAARRVDGFVVEGPTAGGHNAPPRDREISPETGEPVYGARDVVDLEQVRALGLPFWTAGGAGWPERLADALQAGAAGIQVGTLFAYCDESGIAESLRRSVLEGVVRGAVRIRTDGRASPTGFPFKVVSWDGDPAAGVSRKRVCDLGYLRTVYRRGDGTLGYRCASEPEAQFVAKGGAPEETLDRKCLCNGLLSTIGLGQRREDGAVEPPLLTSGDDVAKLSEFLNGRTSYSAADAVRWLLGSSPT